MRERLNRRPAFLNRISVQMYVGVGAAAALTLLASLVAFFSFYQVT